MLALSTAAARVRPPALGPGAEHPAALRHGNEGLYGAVDVLPGVGRRKLNANAGFSFGHNRVAEADDVDTLLQKLLGHFSGEPCIADHDGHDGVESRFDLKPQ